MMVIAVLSFMLNIICEHVNILCVDILCAHMYIPCDTYMHLCVCVLKCAVHFFPGPASSVCRLSP